MLFLKKKTLILHTQAYKAYKVSSPDLWTNNISNLIEFLLTDSWGKAQGMVISAMPFFL